MKQVILTRYTFEGVKQEVIKIGSDCFIGHCGSGRSVLGENGKVTKISENYIYCTSESGSIIKYNIDKKCTCGKWNENFYFIQFNTTQTYCTPEHNTNYIKSRPGVWNSKKCTFEYK